ncbi:MAG TPA: hypothetical protein VKB30_06655, partial [Candidatus Limnocylindrales bacterium]|nr:hypothetical protein [Candidatus Limnocylindrales bacterium]
TRIEYRVTPPDGGPASSSWYGDVSWPPGDRRRSELGWTIPSGADPRGYGYEVRVVDEASGQTLDASHLRPVESP